MTKLEPNQAGSTSGRTKRPARSKELPAVVAKNGSAATPGRVSKIRRLLELLRRAEGADILALQAATAWQAHSVRGALAGTIKKKLGHDLVSEKIDGRRVYRIASVAAQVAPLAEGTDLAG